MLVDGDDKEKSVIDPVIKNRQDRFDLLVVDDKRDKVIVDDDENEKNGIVPVLTKRKDRRDLSVVDNDNDIIVTVHVKRKRKDRFDLFVDNDDKEKITMDPVLQHRLNRFALLVVGDKRDNVVIASDPTKGKDKLDLLGNLSVDDDDKVKIAIDSVLKNRQDIFELPAFLTKILYLKNESEPYKFEKVSQKYVHSDNQLIEFLSIIIAKTNDSDPRGIKKYCENKER